MKKYAQKLLAPFGKLFGAAVSAREKLYCNGFFKATQLNARVVSVGNLTVGGTGKTPLVSFVAGILAENGHKVCVLTRGYKRARPRTRVLVSDGKQVLSDALSAGDEAFELASKLLGTAAVIADKNRAAAGVWASENLGITAFVLDDGFQHLALKRDLDIVCVDATNPFGNEKFLPAGILREALTGLRRADCVVLTRTDLAKEVQNLKLKIQKFNPVCPILFSKTRIVSLTNIKVFSAKPQGSQREKMEIEEQKTNNAFAFCALGNPPAFFESLRQANFLLKATKAFPDHHIYQQIDVDLTEREAKANGAEMLLTTAKDWTKLKNLKFSFPCFVVEIETIFDDDQPLRQMLKKIDLRDDMD